MNILIVYAHPEPTSLNGSLKEFACSLLRSQGHNVRISDLYEMNFNAIADGNDFRERKNPDQLNYLSEQMNASKNKSFSEDILLEQEKLEWADFVIFQFPIWWTEAPAILKGWFDRVFAFGFAYGPGAYDKGNLRGKRAMLSVTHGAPNMNNYGEYGLKGKLEERLFNIQHEKLYFSGMDVLEPFLFPSSAPLEIRDAYFEQYKKRLLHIFEEPTIPFHPLSHYQHGQLVDEFRKDQPM
ncbi:putative NADPH-quinone reductase [Bacillus tianshenii]|uniref:NADPH-quinone reductase n=1 Tax=Sutcliffiella tianshenii TaxID=1463404 RepID=A0ABS2NZP4_9BACI|nr:NAD(P)H-dependent oxidoreductase [Bacillus tianshenii]MBM7620089.1 putative NADPH-quinone reductase [Bacillus tianshenii]